VEEYRPRHKVPSRSTTFSPIISTKRFYQHNFENRPCRRPYLLQRIDDRRLVMTSLGKISGISQCTLAAVAASLWAGEAFASQGPGGGLGTASSVTQTAMAVIVYGTSALVICAGLIGAARRKTSET